MAQVQVATGARNGGCIVHASCGMHANCDEGGLYVVILPHGSRTQYCLKHLERYYPELYEHAATMQSQPTPSAIHSREQERQRSAPCGDASL